MACHASQRRKYRVVYLEMCAQTAKKKTWSWHRAHVALHLASLPFANTSLFNVQGTVSLRD